MATYTARCGHRQSDYKVTLNIRCFSAQERRDALQWVVERGLCNRCYRKVRATPPGCLTILGRERTVGGKRMRP